MNLFYTIMRGILYWPFRLLFPCKVIGKENLPKQRKFITVSNHLCAMDIVLVAIYIPRYRRILGKKEIGKNPFIRFLAKSLGVILIDRSTSDLSAMREVIGALKKGQGLSIFPEGTRNKHDENLQEVKAGAAMFAIKGDAEVVPVMIRHRQKCFRRNYIYVGKPVSLSEYKSKRLDNKRLEMASSKIAENMIKSKDLLADIVDNHRIKEFKTYKKNCKKARKNLSKELEKLL